MKVRPAQTWLMLSLLQRALTILGWYRILIFCPPFFFNASNAVDFISDLPDANRYYLLLIHLSNVGFPLPI